MTAKTYIRVGFTVLRSASGEFYPAVPLFIETESLKGIGVTAPEENMLAGFSDYVIEEYGKRLKEQEYPRTDANSGSSGNS